MVEWRWQDGAATVRHRTCEENGRAQRRSLSMMCVGFDPDGTFQTLRRPPRTVALSGGGSAIWVLEVR